MKKIIALILVMVLTLSMVACGKNPLVSPTPEMKPDIKEPIVEVEPNDPEVTPTEPESPSKPEEPNINSEDLPNPEIEADADKTKLSAFLLDKAYASNGQNTMFSPLSLDMALAIAAEGAGSEYESFLDKLLGKDNYSEFAKEYMEYTKQLNQNSDNEWNKYNTVFEIANSIWIDDNYKVQDGYSERISQFEVMCETLDFGNLANVVKTVNEWCKEKTRDMIDEVVKEDSFNDDSVAVIVNAVYFESPWAETWDVCNGDKKFNYFDGNSSDVKMIETGNVCYYENDHATAFGSQYKNGLTFIGILPKEEGEFMVGDLDLDSLIESQTYEYDVYAKMPTFKFDNKIENLVSSLTEAGYGILFDKENGMFTQMLNDGQKDIPMAISDIIQVDAIELDENGTKAAAVTAIVMDNCASMPMEKETKEVILNRPFAFAIYDSEMNQIVFMGKVVNPQ